MTINTAATSSSVPALITDGPTRKTQIILNNGNLGTTFSITNAANTFSGGVVLANNASGTRLDISAPAVVTALGTGPIIVGQAATDKAGIFFPAAVTVTNPVVMNTNLGTDRYGIRSDIAGVTFSGVLTANVDAVLSGNATTSAIAFTNQITGVGGLVLDASQTSTASTVLNVTLNNATANPNNYAGDTVVGRTSSAPTVGLGTVLTLGRADQIPNGVGFGNVQVLNFSATATGTLNLNGFSETINGLAGSGTVDGVSGNPTLTLGDNNATTTFSGVLKNTAGTLNIVKIGTGTQTFSGANTFTGSLTVNSGLLAFPSSPATAGPLGNTTTVNLNGGGISYTGTTTNVLNRTVSIGAGNGTLDVLSSLGTLSITSVTSTGGNLIKTGPGAAVIAGSTTLNTGAAGVVVNNGVLQAGFGTGGISSINVSALGNLSFQNSAAEVLTLGGTGSLTLASGSKLGFELGAVGTNDEVIYKTATASGTVSLNIINLGGGLGAGSYTLLTSSTAGQLAGVNFTLGSAPAGFNYAIDNDGTTVTLTTLNYQPIYWRGGVDLSWSTLGAGPANWTTDAAGTLDSDHTPAPNETVIFSAALAPTLSNTITTTLNGAFTIDSIQFTNVPTGVTGVTINAGTGGALTLKPASASGGLLLATGAGNVTINAPITLDNTLSPSQTWSVTDATSILNIAGNVAFGANMVKSGAGILTLSGNNTGTGSITLSAGTLNVNSLTALGTGTFNIGGGTTLDNTSGATVAMTANNPVNITGDFTFTGSNSLNLGTGATTLGNSPTITISANTLTVGGAVGGTGGFTKSGAGILVLAGNNTYAGLTTVSQGTLNLLGNNTNAGGVTLSGGALGIGNAGALGTGTFTINSGTIDNLTGAALTTGSNALAVNGSFTFTGSKDLNLGTGPITTSVTPTITVAASTLTLGNNINGANGLTKAGPGALTLSGASTYNGPTTVSAGTLNLTGSFSTPLLGNISVANSATFNVLGPITASNPFTTTVNGGTVNVNSPITDAALGTIAVNSGTLNVAASVTGSAATTTLTYGNTASTTGIVNVTGGTSTLFATQGASVAGAVSVWNQTGGNVTVSPGTGNSQYVVKSVAGAYGYFNLTGGNYKNTGRFDVSATSNVGLGTVGAVFVGGTNALLDNSNGEWFINGYGLNSTTVGVGGTIDRTGASNRVGIMMDSTVSGGTYGVINLAGGNFIQTTLNSFTFGNSATTTSQFGDVGYLNLAGGNLSLGGGVIVNVPTSAPAAINTGYINFSGANIKGTATATLVPASTVGINVISTIFGQTINNGSLGATFNGGATTGLNLDTNGFTITAASPIASASGLGVTQTDMTVAGGSGYVGAPVVQFSTAGLVAGGTPAQGYAVLDGAGHVAGIVITDPGTYAAGTTPTVTLAGGGGTGASITLATLTAANVAGGLNLTDTAGTGNFVVTAANTYTGTTNIGVGAKLSLGAAGTTGALSPSSAIVNNGNLTINRTNAVAQGTEFSTAPITGTGAMTVTGASNTTVVTLNAANTFSGGVTLISTQGTAAGPVLILANSAAAGTGTLTLRSSGFGGADTLQISGSGLNIANPIVMDTTLGFREGIDNVATSGANTLSGGITISGTTAQALIIANNSATGVLTVSGNITATGGNASSVSLRGVGSTGMGLLTGTVTLNGVLDSNVGGIWTIKPATSGANTWTQTQLNSTVAGSGLKLGIDNALPPVDLLWGTTAVGTLDLAGFNQTVAGAAASLATPIITNSGATDSTLTFAALTATKNFTGVIQNGATNKINLVMNSAGQTQILSGANTYSGPTTITAGTLQLGNLGATGTLNPLSTITDNSAFVISRTGTVTQGTDFSTAAITGTGTFTNASSGTTVFTANNTYAGVTTISAGTLQIGAGGTVGSMGPNSITDTGTLSFNRTDTFTMLATQLVTGTGGVTLMNSGPVVASVDNQFNVSGPLTFGASAGATTASTLDLTGASSTFGPLTVLTNNPTANTIIVGPGKTLTNNGNVTIGYATPQATASVVKLTMTGGGNYVATGSGATFQVGGSTSTTLSEASTLDMTGLASATINLGATGTFRVAQPSGTNLAGNQSTLLLPAPSTGVTPTTPVTTITTNLFNVGDNSGNVGNAGQTNAVTLGTGLTTLNVNTINVGTGGRDLGQITVAAGNGTIKLRAADGASRVAVNIGTGTANTAVGQGTGVTNKIDFTGHSADLQISTLAIGAQNRNTNRDDLFAFDTGNLDVTGVVLATNTGAANGTVATGIVNTSTLSIGGGTTTIGAGGVDIGFGQTAVTATSTHTLIGNLNVSGGSVTIANNPTLGAAIRMSNNTIAAGLTANSNLNVTGSGSVALAGDIIKGSSAGAGTASIAVNGPTALLDMGGHNIGTATAIINSFAYTDGVVKDLGIAYGPVTLAGTGSRVFNQTGVQSGEIRGVVSGTGVGLSKTGTGSLTLSGTNTYTGSTTVSAGMLLVNGSIGTSASTVQSGGTLSGTGTTGTVSVLSGGTVTGGSTFASIAGKLSTADLGMASGSTLAMDIDGTTAGNGAGKYDQLSITGAIDLNTDAGTGANLVVNFPNNFAPTIGDVYYVALNDGTDPVNNFFNGLPEGQVVLGSNGSQFTISYLANGDGGTVANDIALTTTIPEPATASLLAVAGIGLLSRRRRRAGSR